MSRANNLAKAFLRQTSEEEKKAPVPTQQLVQSKPINSFRNLFDYKELQKEEAEDIKELLWSHSEEQVDTGVVQRDVEQLQHLTAEIRSISKQGIILLGERIYKARSILKRYGDGSGVFTQWLNATFGNRRSAYNMLAYYEFYTQLPNQEFKDLLKSMPVQAVYSLASRPGEIKDKLEIIRLSAGKRQKEILALIQELLPLPSSDARSSKVSAPTLDSLERSCENLLSSSLNQEHRTRIRGIITKLESLLQKSALSD